MSRFGISWCLQHVDYDHMDFSKTFTRTVSSPHAPSPPRSTCGEVQAQVSPSHEDSGFLDGSFSFSSDVLDDEATSRLRESILDPTKHSDIPHIISTWPRNHLRLKDAVTAEELHWSIPDTDILWKMMFQSLVNRQPECQLEVLDLTQFRPSSGLLHLMIQILPILYLSEEKRNPEHIIKTVTKHLGLTDSGLLHRLRTHISTVLQHRVFSRGPSLNNQDGSLTVLMDELPIDEDQLIFLSLLTCTGLQQDTGLYVLPRSVVSKGEWNQVSEDGKPTTNHELLLLQQKHINQALDGLELTSPSSRVMHAITLRNLTNLSLTGLNTATDKNTNNNNCVEKISSQSISKSLSQFDNLQRLELKNSNLIGCLPEVLKALQRPLGYLSISGSTVSPSDIRAFKTWRYSSVLKDLNVSNLNPSESVGSNEPEFETRLTNISVGDNNIPEKIDSNGLSEFQTEMMVAVTEMLRYLPSLVVMDTHGNHISLETFQTLGDAVSENLKELKMLRINGCHGNHEQQGQHPDDEPLLHLVAQLKDHLSFQILYVTRTCRCVNHVTCCPGCKMEFWSRVDDVIGNVPVRVCVEML